jgi:hypothetical protein
MTPESLAHLVRPITPEQAITSFKALKETDGPNAGLKTIDRHFLSQRILTKGKTGVSFYEAFNDPVRYEFLHTLVKRYKRMDKPSSYLAVCQLWHGAVSAFRPHVAKQVYQRFRPKVGVLDFSAGWGGRCLASMALGIPYIGIDANTDLQPCYEALRQYQPEADITMRFQPAETVDYSSFQYDLVFTSPPYYHTEHYPNMPEYHTKQDFLQRFLLPVIHQSWKHLLPGGTMALNLPEWLYVLLNSVYPACEDRLPMRKMARFAKVNPNTHEWIYVWHKRATAS